MTNKTGTFTFHGVHFSGERGDQAYGDCIFCGGTEKFYVNKTNGLWDCKTCGLHGNASVFLKHVYELALKEITDSDLSKLCINRKLPKQTFVPWQIGKRNNSYVIPVKNELGHIQDLRMYRLGDKMKGTTGCSVGLMGLDEMVKSSPSDPVYICEGEWDGMAMQWLLKHLKKPGAVVAVPGANTFKEEWAPFFRERVVYTCYDHDEAGRMGEMMAHERLQNQAKEIYFTHWNSVLPEGYDLRDLISAEAIKYKRPAKAFEIITKNFRNVPRKSSAEVIATAAKEEPVGHVTLEEVYKVFDKWLYLPDHDGIDMMLAVILSTKIPGDPLWMFLVAPPGGAKTEILNTASLCPSVFMTSSLTPHTLISGSSLPGGGDASLLPFLDSKTLIIKDFTSILGMPEMAKNEIFGQMRDAYDGHSGKSYGHGQRKYFKSHFSVLAGVTTSIHHLGDQYASLGERFLKFSIGDNLTHKHEKTILRRAMRNVSMENTMREELSSIVKKFIAYRSSKIEKSLPEISESIGERIIALSQFCARVRGSVARDRYYNDIMLSKPSAEFGTRLCKQFTKLLIALAGIKNKRVVGEDEYAMCRKTALDTISQRNEDIVRYLLKITPTIDDSIRTAEIAHYTKYSVPTIQRLMADMYLLDIVKRVGKTNAYEWTVSEYMRGLIKEAEIYE